MRAHAALSLVGRPHGRPHPHACALPCTVQAKELLARYGGAYLLTSISFAIVSLAACYLAVDAGVDVGALLDRFGLQVGASFWGLPVVPAEVVRGCKRRCA